MSYNNDILNEINSNEINSNEINSNKNDEWITITKKLKKEIISQKQNKNISYDELVKIIKNNLKKYEKYIVAGYLYGSRARGTNKLTSDADIIIFWKTTPNIEELKLIRSNIEYDLNIDIDFVSCVYTKKNVIHTEERDIAYFENVMNDAKQFIGDSINIAILIDYSIKLKKLKR